MTTEKTETTTRRALFGAAEQHLQSAIDALTLLAESLEEEEDCEASDHLSAALGCLTGAEILHQLAVGSLADDCLAEPLEIGDSEGVPG